MAKWARPQILVATDAYVDESAVDANGVIQVNLGDGEVLRGTSSGAEGVASSTLGGGDYERLYRSSADSSVITNTTSETTYDTSSHTIDAGTLVAGDEIRTGIYGRYFSQGFSNGRCDIRLKAGSVELATLGVLNAADGLVKYFSFEANTEVRAIGASGSFVTTVHVRFFGNGMLKFTNRVVKTVDTTKSVALGITAQWTAASSANITDLSRVAYDRIKA